MEVYIRKLQRYGTMGDEQLSNCAGFMVGSGGCSLCKPCAIVRGEPCTFPDLRYSCMSAYCIFVRKLCEGCGIEYDGGSGLLTLYGMYVFD